MYKELILVPPNDPRVLSAVAPFTDEIMKENGYNSRKEIVSDMFDTMYKYGGLGLSANQVGLPFNLFVMGGHPQIEKGIKVACFNPKILEFSKDEIILKEGCLTFPFVFLSLSRPKKVTVEYEDENGEQKKAYFDGYLSRIFQHEHDHMLGRVFTERASKFKLDLAYEKAKKQIDKAKKRKEMANG
jgi:peptide deformylase